MKVLILETSTEKGLIVLAKDGIPMAIKRMAGGPELSRTLALEVNLLLKEHSAQPDYLAVGTGPGSYTGIRVGAALAKALALGWQAPLFGFCSLSAFVTTDAPRWAVLFDARIGGLYTLTNDSPSPTLLSISEAHDKLKEIPLLFSPHPELVQKRISLSGRWIESWPDPNLLASLAHSQYSSKTTHLEGPLFQGDPPPLALSYLTIP